MRARGMLSKLHSPQEEVVAFAKRRLLRIVVLFKYWMQNHWARDFAGVRTLPHLIVCRGVTHAPGPTGREPTVPAPLRDGREGGPRARRRARHRPSHPTLPDGALTPRAPLTVAPTLTRSQRSGKVLLSEPMPPAIPPPLIADADVGPLLVHHPRLFRGCAADRLCRRGVGLHRSLRRSLRGSSHSKA